MLKIEFTKYLYGVYSLESDLDIKTYMRGAYLGYQRTNMARYKEGTESNTLTENWYNLQRIDTRS